MRVAQCNGNEHKILHLTAMPKRELRPALRRKAVPDRRLTVCGLT